MSSEQNGRVIFVLYGSDAFSRGEGLHELKRELDTDGSLASNTTAFDAGQTTPAEVMAACDTVPFLGGRRLVVVDGALGLAGASGRGRRSKKAPVESDGDTAGQGPWWALVEYAERMPETTALVLVDGGGIDEALLEAMKPFATIETFPLPSPREVTGWVQARARARGLQIDQRACALIAELVGTDTGIIASEIDKLAMYAAGARITENEVKALVSDVSDRAGYLLADAVSEGKSAEATRLLHQLLSKGHVPPVLLLTIENRYRRLAVARHMLDEGATGAQIGAKLRMSGYGLERLVDQASRMSWDRVRWALDRIAQSDQDLKEGRIDGENLALELLVHDLTAGVPRTAKSQRVSAAAGSS